ncbi:MAG: hypothetical protein DIU72_004760 [Pseudomonadota bacterium]|nr:MAG: hypothetical protein DIU72_04755 [Pseudomonadota bacterium]
MQHKVPQLLSVWNPYFEPETIQVHVEILRQYRKVWWARLYRGERMDRAACRDKYARLAQLWDDARAEGRCVVLFVTNFVALHALLVDEILFGPELPPEEIAYAPAHYFQEPDDPKGPWPVLWFRVRDVRALAYDQVHTLRYFFDREIDAGDFGYDPFASFKWRYPEVAMAPPAEEIFDPELLAGRARMFADLHETLFPPEVQTARVELEKKLGETWLGLEERSRTFLASGWVVYRQFRRHRDFDLSNSLTGAMRAVETELCDALVKSIVKALRLEYVFGNWEITLGACNKYLDELANRANQGGVRALELLATNGSWRDWLERFVALRNDTAHGKVVKRQRVERAWAELVGMGSELGPIVAAKRAWLERLGR